MTEPWVHAAADFCGPDYGCGSGRWMRLTVKLVIAYFTLAALCWIELKFRQQSIDLEARVEIVGDGPRKCGSPATLRVRYHFHDPLTGKPRMNTELVNRDRAPVLGTATVEYVPGEYPMSRLKSEAHPAAPSIFLWVNAVFFSGVAGLLGYIAWEANRPIGGRKRRRIPWHPDTSPKRWTIV
jgi:hypothetical protein